MLPTLSGIGMVDSGSRFDPWLTFDQVSSSDHHNDALALATELPLWVLQITMIV